MLGATVSDVLAFDSMPQPRRATTLGGVTSSLNSMSSASTHFFATSRTMGIYERNHQMSMWSDSFKADSSQNTGASTIVEADTKLDNRVEDVSHEMLRLSKKYDQEGNKPPEKVLRRLAQNREAARKSRLRKKAYVQQLETSRIKLAQLEQELERTRQQSVYIGGHSGDSTVGLSGTVNSGVAAFEMEYGHWVEEHNRQICELRTALQAHISDLELHMLVESGLSHYDDLFRIKAIAAKSDVFYLMSGMWKTATERFFLWIGGFRPSELLKILSPQLDPLTEQQVMAVYNLQQSSQQAEDALSQGLDKLQQTLSETLASDALGSSGVANYMGQMANAMGKLEALASFVNQTHETGRPPSAGGPATDVQDPNDPASSTRPACVGRLFPAPSCPELPLGGSPSGANLVLRETCYFIVLTPLSVGSKIAGVYLCSKSVWPANLFIKGAPGNEIEIL